MGYILYSVCVWGGFMKCLELYQPSIGQPSAECVLEGSLNNMGGGDNSKFLPHS